MPKLSKARMWEHKIKSSAWGVDETGFGELPYELRRRIWNEAMCQGDGCQDPTPETLFLIEQHRS
jgi:hypothetical protein